MIAGGASLAPRRWSWPASAMLARSRSACTLTARMTATRKARNWAFACGVCPGSSRFSPVVGGHRPVVVLARAVDAGERLLVEQEHRPCWRREAPHRAHARACCGRSRPRSARRPGPSRTGPGATSLWRVLDGMPSRQQLAVEVHHEGEDPLADGAEVLVLELLALGRRRAEERAAGEDRSGRCSARRRSTRKYSCSGPMVVKTRLAVVLPNQRRTRRACLPRASCERSSGILWSSASPVYETNAVGMRQGHAVRLDLQEDRAGDVPGGVAAGLEGGADAAGREGAGVGLALDQAPCRRTRRSSGRRRSGSGTSRASRRWSRSSAGTSGCSGWRRARGPTPSRRGRPRRRSPGRRARGRRSCAAAA